MSMGALSAVRCFERGHGARVARYMHIDQGLVIHNTHDYAHGLLGAAQPAFFRRVRALLDRLSGLPMLSYAGLPGSVRRELGRVFGEFAHAGFAHPGLASVVARIAQWPQLLSAFLPAEGLPTHVKIMRAYLERAYDFRRAFAAIEAPTTVLIGGASRMYPAAGQRMMASAGAMRMSEIAAAGHMLPLEAPRRFLQELNAFLQPWSV
jgi:pimeloyl-ACP methyl ester carboxylesterase